MSKYYEVINTVYVNEDENIVLTPGQIVEIEFINTPNYWPCLVIDCELFDLAFDDEDEFNEFFREFDKQERVKMIKAMEFIARHINDDYVRMSWFAFGVADGDIKYGDLSDDYVDEYYLQDDNFKDLMSVFMKRMKYAYEDGGLYCDKVNS